MGGYNFGSSGPYWNGISMLGGGNAAPTFGNTWFVDGTNGLDSNRGRESKKAFKTIQRAIDIQIANSTGLGDVIYILPGTYAESVYAVSLSNVSIIGVHADLVFIAPTAGHAFQIGADGSAIGTTMTNCLLRGITFFGASTTNTEYAACNIGVCRYSVIEDCKFMGTTVSTYEGLGNDTIGLQFGDRTGAFSSTYELHSNIRISRCMFSAKTGGRTWEWTYGLMVGDVSISGADKISFNTVTIENCQFFVYDRGIQLNSGAASHGGTVIKDCIVTSNQGGTGPNIGIRYEGGATDLLCMLLDNRITAINDAISGFSTCNCQGNIVAVGGGTPDTEYQDS
jgi:hypothetical protein